MVVNRFGKACYVESFGVRDELSGEAMSSDCVFQIASMTKTVTSVAAMMLYEDGQLGLDDPVCTWFPQLSKGNLQVAGADGKAEPCREDITVRHLMTHTSGLTYGFLFRRPAGDPVQQAEDVSLKSGEVATPEDFSKQLLAFQPGSRFRYSNSTLLLGFVVEAVSRVSLDVFFHDRIFTPLGMKRTRYLLSDEELGLLARQQLGTAERTMKPSMKNFLKCTFEEDRGAPSSGCLSLMPRTRGKAKAPGDAGLFSSPEDWNLFMSMLAHRGSGIMAEKTFEVMVAPATPDLSDQIFNTHMTDAASSGGVALCGSNGLGSGGFAHSLVSEVVIGPNIYGASLGSFGWEGLVSTKYMVDPSEGLAVAFWSNIAPCWRYRIKAEALPLVYKAITAPRGSSRLHPNLSKL
eukprot:TRINITY_DN77163_c0_g1_i1.p1 TRINITY_DN77163_c0_g1~~TRINITY_DN77163_c0_g1_i1.p1  ORF type:complete len:450 (-),score=71.31 TRINITY_DN77163_c0_g1_i1:18-1232(-)